MARTWYRWLLLPFSILVVTGCSGVGIGNPVIDEDCMTYGNMPSLYLDELVSTFGLSMKTNDTETIKQLTHLTIEWKVDEWLDDREPVTCARSLGEQIVGALHDPGIGEPVVTCFERPPQGFLCDYSDLRTCSLESGLALRTFKIDDIEIVCIPGEEAYIVDWGEIRETH